MYFKKKAWIAILLLAFFWGGVGNAFGGSATLNWTANEESDLNEYRVYFGERSRNYGPYIPVPSGTQYTVEGLEAGKTYYFAVTAVDTSGNESGFSREVSKTIAAAADTVAPDIQILQPTDAEFFIAQSPTISLAGSASDNVGVTAVSWSTDTGASGQANGTTAWEIPDLSLSADQTTITVAALDEAGNRAESSILISYADSRSAFSVSQVQAASGKTYTIHSGLANGETSYVDRSYSYSQLPAELQGSHYIRTANNDKGSNDSGFVRFIISEDAAVFIAHDDRITTKPDWLNSFSDTGMDLISADKPMSLFKKKFPSGEVVLGGNVISPANCNMYTVVVRRGGMAPDSEPTPEPEPEPEPQPEPAPEPGDIALAVREVRAASGEDYIAVTGLQDGETSYLDRSYAYDEVPGKLVGGVYIRVANDDKTSTRNDFLRFNVSQGVDVYVAHDDRITRKPDWLGSFSDTGMDLISADKPMSLFKKKFPSGEVVLGGNVVSPANCNMYTVAVLPAAGASGPDPEPGDIALAVREVRAASGEDYIAVTGLQDGETSYLDRSYAYDEVPNDLVGSVYVRTANDNKLSSGNDFLRFSITRDAVVYVAHDDRIRGKPSWMLDFSDTGMDLITADVPMSLFQKRFSAGEVVLGGNGATSGQTNNYTVIVGSE
ncbi:MAG: fibronectin type III domain-containing protein [Desulfococcaceae bacterium]